MTITNASEAITYINENNEIEFQESFNISKLCASMLRDSNTVDNAREIVIRMRDAWDRVDEYTKPIWNDLTEACGLYPYVDPDILSRSSQLRYEYHKSSYLGGVYLHEEQQILSAALLEKKSVVVSAPTSFGKSLLIEEIVASGIYRNIVIIQPTLALLDETRKKLLKYRDRFKIIVSTSQDVEEDRGNIFLFTGERVVEYEKFKSVDFFIIDEFYKLSMGRDDDRAITLNYALHKLLKYTQRFYMLGPMIGDIPNDFKERFGLLWFPSTFATVAVNESNVEVNGKPNEKKILKKQLLFELLSNSNAPTLIYCSSPAKATQLCIEYVDYMKANNLIKEQYNNNDTIEWIEENLNPRWSIVEGLRNGVSFHHGALPRHLGSSIVDAFNEGNVKSLFCTSTLIEGVNTTAKTVILFDKKKGTKEIDFFDYKNIAGRSGRMKIHFIGNVVRFEKQPVQTELFVDIPIFNQEKAPVEILMALDDNELSDVSKIKLSKFQNLPENLKNIVKENYGISLDGQLAIIAEIENNFNHYQSLLSWTGYPTYDQLLAVIDLAWRHLTKPGDNKAEVRSAKQLTVLTMRYSSTKSIQASITACISDPFWVGLYPTDQERINKATFFILNISRHWFDYKLPRWIAVISKLQEYVFEKNNLRKGNFTFFATMLEHGFLPPNLATMTEYDIPLSAIVKLQKILREDIMAETLIGVLNRLSDDALLKRGLLMYEINKIRKAL